MMTMSPFPLRFKFANDTAAVIYDASSVCTERRARYRIATTIPSRYEASLQEERSYADVDRFRTSSSTRIPRGPTKRVEDEQVRAVDILVLPPHSFLASVESMYHTYAAGRFPRSKALNVHRRYKGDIVVVVTG